jgi:hypothetical protein
MPAYLFLRLDNIAAGVTVSLFSSLTDGHFANEINVKSY